MDEESDKKPVIDPSKRPLPPRPTDNQDHDGIVAFISLQLSITRKRFSEKKTIVYK